MGENWAVWKQRWEGDLSLFIFLYLLGFQLRTYFKKIKTIPKPSDQGSRTATDSSTTALLLSPQPPPRLGSGLRTVLCVGTQPPSDGGLPARRPRRPTLWSTADSTLPRARASGKDPSAWEEPGVPETQRRALDQPLRLCSQREKCFLKPCCASEAVDLICKSTTIHQWT